MMGFADFIEKLGLLTCHLKGACLCGSGTDLPVMSRIDRVLILLDWEEHFSYVTIQIFPRLPSDHSPILVEVGGILGEEPFFI